MMAFHRSSLADGGLLATCTTAPVETILEDGALPLAPQICPPADAPPSSKAQSGEDTRVLLRQEDLVVADIPADSGPAEDLSQRRIGRFYLCRKIARGGMSSVYLARQLPLDRVVALKVLPPHLATNPLLLSRFIQEGKAAALLTHQNIVRVYDADVDRGIYHIAMEYVRGTDLHTMVEQSGKLPHRTAAALILQAARGLEYMHGHGLVHRDVKPSNLLVNENGVVKVCDMGLAKLPQQFAAPRAQKCMDILIGTPKFMAPEQAADPEAADHRSDQYSLGCSLYYLCTGRAPFTSDSTDDLLRQHSSEDAPPLEEQVEDLPAELLGLVTTLLAKNPDGRFAAMEDVVRRLERLTGTEACPCFRPPSAWGA